MLRHDGYLIGDAWFWAEEDCVHCFYLTYPKPIKPHTLWHIGHATSTDLVHWEIHPLALEGGTAGAWDESLATGSIARDDSHYVMAFTGHFAGETGLAWSRDFFHWTKCEWNPITRPDGIRYGLEGVGHRKMRHWRDPFLFRHEGNWHQLVCANLQGDVTARGVVGHCVSKDLRSWETLEPLMTEAFGEEMECPQIHQRDGLYYLVFSTPQEALFSKWKERLGEQARSGSYMMVSENLLGPYRVCRRPGLLPDSLLERPYACQIVHWQEQDFCLGTIWRLDSSFVCNPIRIRLTPTGSEMV